MAIYCYFFSSLPFYSFLFIYFFSSLIANRGLLIQSIVLDVNSVNTPFAAISALMCTRCEKQQGSVDLGGRVAGNL